MRLLRTTVALPVGLAVVLLAASPALAAIRDVDIQGFQFDPRTATAALDDTVRWTNRDTAGHTATSDGYPDGSGYEGVGLWTTGVLTHEESGSFTFFASGRFPYHCRIHTGMQGTVSVPMKGPATGVVNQRFRVRWATMPPPEPDLAYDVQIKLPGGEFRDWRTLTTTESATYLPRSAGNYQFRARVVRFAGGLIVGAGQYSRPKTVSVS